MLSVALCLLGSGAAVASPEFVDEQALENGAKLYAVYCSDCHGIATAQRSEEPESEAVNYAELIDQAQAKATAEANAVREEEEEWPEWAGPRVPNQEDKPDDRAEIANLMTAVIEQAYGPTHESENPGENVENHKRGDFEPMPGVTDLSDPGAFFYGTSAEEVFKSIANGTGAAMPGWRTELGSDEAIWDVVNYIRSFWDEGWL